MHQNSSLQYFLFCLKKAKIKYKFSFNFYLRDYVLTFQNDVPLMNLPNKIKWTGIKAMQIIYWLENVWGQYKEYRDFLAIYIAKYFKVSSSTDKVLC